MGRFDHLGSRPFAVLALARLFRPALPIAIVCSLRALFWATRRAYAYQRVSLMEELFC